MHRVDPLSGPAGTADRPCPHPRHLPPVLPAPDTRPARRSDPDLLLALQGYRDREVDLSERADRGPAVPGLPADDLPGVQAGAPLGELVTFFNRPPLMP